MSSKAHKTIAESPEEEPKTCFVMMPISDVEGYPVGHFGEVYTQLIEPAVTAAGYKCELATSTSAAHMIQLEVVTKVATADLCICDMSTKNANVMFEYGIRQAFDKPTVLIKDNRTDRIFDLSGFRDIEYDHTLRIANTLAAREKITTAIRDTVNGADDGKQIFSLVKLMQLTKAAIPTDHVDAQDARFELLNQKLDRLTRSINPPVLPPRPPEFDLSPEHVIGLGSNELLHYEIRGGDLIIRRPDGAIVDTIRMASYDVAAATSKYGFKTASNIRQIISDQVKR